MKTFIIIDFIATFNLIKTEMCDIININFCEKMTFLNISESVCFYPEGVRDASIALKRK